jgi:hypothetical protein
MIRDLCKHDLDPGTCSVCSGRDKGSPPVLDPSEFGPWFAARFPGRCSACNKPFNEDAQIRADGQGGYLADACGEGAL